MSIDCCHECRAQSTVCPVYNISNFLFPLRFIKLCHCRSCFIWVIHILVPAMHSPRLIWMSNSKINSKETSNNQSLDLPLCSRWWLSLHVNHCGGKMTSAYCPYGLIYLFFSPLFICIVPLYLITNLQRGLISWRYWCMSGLCLLQKQHICSYLKQQTQQASLTVNHLQNYNCLCYGENSSEQQSPCCLHWSLLAQRFLENALIRISLRHGAIEETVELINYVPIWTCAVYN